MARLLTVIDDFENETWHFIARKCFVTIIAMHTIISNWLKFLPHEFLNCFPYQRIFVHQVLSFVMNLDTFYVRKYFVAIKAFDIVIFYW